MLTSITAAIKGGGAAGAVAPWRSPAQTGSGNKGKPNEKKLLGLAAIAALGLSASAAQAQTVASATLDAVKAKGFVQCGVTGGVPGFSAPDANNVWTGLEVDYCRALAAAIFNDRRRGPLHPAHQPGALHRALRR